MKAVAVVLRSLLLLAAALVVLPNDAATSLAAEDVPKVPWTIKFADADRDVLPLLEKPLAEGRERVERFFGRPFKKPFEVEVFPGRDRFDAYFNTRWKIPRTQKWMVASGVGDKLTVLSPRVWKSEAAEHDPSDEGHVRELIAHELVHVYHGQYNPTGDFEGMDDLGWFVEGLAVYVSGQMENAHRDAARKAVAEGKAPASLAKAWGGKYRYGVCGSMVRFIDQKWGRKTLWGLVPEVKQDSILKALGMTEKEFLQSWAKSVSDPAK